MGVKLGLSH